MADESKIIKVGTAPKVVPDDMSRDIAMVRNPRFLHKLPPSIKRDPNTIWGGHIVWLESGNYFANVTVNGTSVDDDITITSPTTKSDLSAYIPNELEKDIKGIVVFSNRSITISKDKVLIATYKTYCTGNVRFATSYGATPGTYNLIAIDQKFAEVTGSSMNHRGSSQNLVPIFWNNHIPYLTWNVYGSFQNMDTNNAAYLYTCSLYIHGYIM